MKRFSIIWVGMVITVLVGGLIALKGRPLILLIMTPEQVGQRLYNRGEFVEAAKWFRTSARQGAALFRAANFKDAAGCFAGTGSAAGVYNQGNALAMQGMYEDAILRYLQALELQPGWPEAETNLEIARQSTARLKQTGGAATELGADDFVFTGEKQDPAASEPTVPEPIQETNTADMHAVWLRQVQTRPADFLRSKFAYQTVIEQEGNQE
jgi:Ca-activated chloride channel family protein